MHCTLLNLLKHCVLPTVYVCIYFLLFSEYEAVISFTQLPSSPFVIGAQRVFCKVQVIVSYTFLLANLLGFEK